jgi:hypothetical protein
MGWRIVNGVNLRGHGTIDHVLIGPGGVFVIESRWASRRCAVEQAAIVRIHGSEPVTRARQGAHRVERMLRASSDQIDVTVQPMVVVWGPGSPKFDAGWASVEGVSVYEGRQAEQWIGQLDNSEVSQLVVDLITEKLNGQGTHFVDQPAVAPSR